MSAPAPATRAARAALVVAGAAVAAVTAIHPAFRRAVDGSLLPAAAVAWGVALGLALLGLCAGTRWARAGAWLGLAVVGQAAALALIDAPAYNVLEHYAAWTELLRSPRALLLAVVAAQSLVVSFAVPGFWRRLDPAGHGIGGARLALALLVLLAASANGSFDPGRYAGELALAGWLLVVNLLNVALAADALPADSMRAAAAAVDRAGHRVPVLCALWVLVACTAISWLVFDRTPIIPDSVSYLIQAKYFAAGRLSLDAPPELPAFDFEKLHSDGTRWWAYGFPGWPAVLAIGVRLGVPWLVNPVLGALTVLLLHALLMRLYDAPFARRATLLLAASPWFLFMSASHMPHPVSTVWLLLVLLALHSAARGGGLLAALGAGAALGALFLTRPLEALLLAPLIGLVLLGATGQPVGWAGRAAFVAGGAAVASLSFAYNAALTGSALTAPHAVWSDARWYPGADRIGFGADVGNLGWPHLDPLPGHGPLDVAINAQQNVYMVNADLFGWVAGSLVLVIAWLLWGQRRRADRLFLGTAALIAVGHGVYWFSGGPDIGARYWYQVLVPLVVLTARGAQDLNARWAGEAASPGGRMARAGAFVAVASLVALVTFNPWRALGKYHDYRGMNAHLARLAHSVDFGRSVVFVREGSNGDYPRAILLNPADFDGPDPIWARDLGPESRARILRRYPDRPWWIVQGPADPSAPFLVIEGPVRP